MINDWCYILGVELQINPNHPHPPNLLNSLSLLNPDHKTPITISLDINIFFGTEFQWLITKTQIHVQYNLEFGRFRSQPNKIHDEAANRLCFEQNSVSKQHLSGDLL